MASHLTEKEGNSIIDQKRFAFIELMLIWEGRIQIKHISSQFELSEKLAKHILQKYKNLYPDNLLYQGSNDCYQVTQSMVAQFSSGSLQEYMQIMGGNDNVSSLELPNRNLQPEIIRPILQAIREQRRLQMGYASVSAPEFSMRVIQPHHLVFDGMRWHVRGFCEKNQDYRDFVLSRFQSPTPAELLNDADHFDLQDEAWNTLLSVSFMPDPRLDDNRARIIALDYDMEKALKGYRKTMKVRQALLMYWVQRMGLNQYNNNPQAQQIILTPESEQMLKEYLP
ncbi:YafY family protein [Oceaniserpentilla sp. 4NH20-0058]|uniref:helix-turn-helix transcriptional regulator n=1 Tax=Oceaniserpentilla sp. 4NH20-0058 TaxID=3127660 RepID=UPI0031093F62